MRQPCIGPIHKHVYLIIFSTSTTLPEKRMKNPDTHIVFEQLLFLSSTVPWLSSNCSKFCSAFRRSPSSGHSDSLSVLPTMSICNLFISEHVLHQEMSNSCFQVTFIKASLCNIYLISLLTPIISSSHPSASSRRNQAPYPSNSNTMSRSSCPFVLHVWETRNTML